MVEVPYLKLHTTTNWVLGEKVQLRLSVKLMRGLSFVLLRIFLTGEVSEWESR